LFILATRRDRPEHLQWHQYIKHVTGIVQTANLTPADLQTANLTPADASTTNAASKTSAIGIKVHHCSWLWNP